MDGAGCAADGQGALLRAPADRGPAGRAGDLQHDPAREADPGGLGPTAEESSALPRQRESPLRLARSRGRSQWTPTSPAP